MRRLFFFTLAAAVFLAGNAFCAEKTPFYLWLEPEWFDGVSGNFAYWPGPESAKKALVHWAVAGPGISAEWSQGGESEWNSMGAGADETNAECRKTINIPGSGRYRIWVRYVDHRKLTEPFSIIIEKNNKKIIEREFGIDDVVPVNDEYQLYWGFSFGWGFVEGEIPEGQAILKIVINKPAQAWRQIDVVCITDDFNWNPSGRKKPDFAYFSAFTLRPTSTIQIRGNAKSLVVGSIWKRPALAGRDFSMWTGISTDKNWWSKQDISNLSIYDVFLKIDVEGTLRLNSRKNSAAERIYQLFHGKAFCRVFILEKHQIYQKKVHSGNIFRRQKLHFT